MEEDTHPLTPSRPLRPSARLTPPPQPRPRSPSPLRSHSLLQPSFLGRQKRGAVAALLNQGTPSTRRFTANVILLPCVNATNTPHTNHPEQPDL